VQGNCSSPDAAAALGFSALEKAALLPLKPRQCLVMVPDMFLQLTGGRFWMHNLYIRLQRSWPLVDFAFVVAGDVRKGMQSQDVFLTSITFHGEHRGRAHGVWMDTRFARLFLQGADPTTLQVVQRGCTCGGAPMTGLVAWAFRECGLLSSSTL